MLICGLSGSRIYEGLKAQLDECVVMLIDTYCIISGEKVNTLDHVGFKYNWSEFSIAESRK